MRLLAGADDFGGRTFREIDVIVVIHPLDVASTVGKVAESSDPRATSSAARPMKKEPCEQILARLTGGSVGDCDRRLSQHDEVAG